MKKSESKYLMGAGTSTQFIQNFFNIITGFDPAEILKLSLDGRKGKTKLDHKQRFYLQCKLIVVNITLT